MKHRKLNFVVGYLLIASGVANAATPPVCTVTFDKETPVIATVIDLPGKSNILVAESKQWLQAKGARVEIEYLVSDGKRSPLTAFMYSLRSIETVNGGGNTIQVPTVEPLRRGYWFDPVEELQIKGPTGEVVAIVKCDRKF